MTAGDGQVPRGCDPEDIDEVELSKQEKKDEDEAMEEMSSGPGKRPRAQEMGIPALDEEQEYEWKWKVSGATLNQTRLTSWLAEDGSVQEDVFPLTHRSSQSARQG